MIKFRCDSCDKKIGVPYKYGGKRIRCPQCSNPAKVPSVVSAIDDEYGDLLSPVSGGSNIWTDELLATSMEQPKIQAEKMVCPECGRKVAVDKTVCPKCDYSFIPDVEAVIAPIKDAAISNFWKDLVKLVSPIRNFSDALIFSVLVTTVLFTALTSNFPMFIFAKILAYGYITAYLLKVLLETANGDNNLPDLPAIFSVWDDILSPFLRFNFSLLYAWAPWIILATVYIKYYPSESLDNSETGGIISVVTIITMAGLFFWPMTLLTQTLGNCYFVRPDKIIMSILRTIGPYIVCCLSIYVVYYVWFITLVGNVINEANYFTIMAAVHIGGMSILIFAMRTLGLLYRHYHEQLDW